MKTYETATIAGLARPDGWSPIRRELGIRSSGVNAWTAGEPGAAVIPEHDEAPSGHEEFHLVVAGRATFAVDGDELSAPMGTIVFGDTDAALEHLAAAVADAPRLASNAREDSDLDPIRDDPRFPA